MDRAHITSVAPVMQAENLHMQIRIPRKDSGLLPCIQCYRARCIEDGKEDEFFNVSDLFAVDRASVFP